MAIAEKLTTVAENVVKSNNTIEELQSKNTELTFEINTLEMEKDNVLEQSDWLLKEQTSYIGDDYDINDTGAIIDVANRIEVARERNPLVYEAGQQAEYDRFWDGYQKSGARRGYNYAFQSQCWTDETYDPKYPIVASSATNLFVSNPNITDTKVSIDLCGCFINNTFSWSGLTKIREIIVDEATTQAKASDGSPNGFNGLSNLTYLKVTGTWACGNWDLSWSPLDKESITSIINALSAETEGFTLTLKKTAVNNAFGIDVDDETTYPDGSEYYILRHSKDNWTISYS